MGNEMGNNNVSGLQENDNDKFDAPCKSSEVHITVIGDDSVKAEDQPVSSSKDDFHEDFISGNPSVIGDPRTEMEVSAKTDADNTEEQTPNGFSRDLLMLSDKETEQFSSSENGLFDEIPSASEKNPALISESTIQYLIEPETTEVQPLDESPKHQLVSDYTIDEGACSILPSEGGRIYEADSGSDDNISKTSEHQIQKQISIPTDPVESSTPSTSDDPKDEDIKSVSSPKDGSVYEKVSATKENTSETVGRQVHKQASEEREGEDLMNSSPDTLNSESEESINPNEELKPDNIDAEPYVEDGRILLQRSEGGTLGLSGPHYIEEKGKEFENETKDQVDGSVHHITSSEFEKLGDDMQREEIKFQEDTLLDKESEPFSSSEDGYVDEIASVSEKNPAQTSDSKIRDLIDPVESSIELISNDLKGEYIQSASSPEDECFVEIASASEKNELETIDRQAHKEASNGQELEELMNSSPKTALTLLNSEFTKSILNDEQLKVDSIDVEPYEEDGGILQRRDTDILGMCEAHDTEEKKKKLEDERQHAQDESALPISSSEVEKPGDDMQREEIKSQEDASLDNSRADKKLKIEIGDHVEETLRSVLDVEAGLNEQQSQNLEVDRRDSSNSQPDVIPAIRSLESFQVDNTKSEDKFVVLADDTNLFENGYRIEQNKESPNMISLSDSEEEPKVDGPASYVSSCASIVEKAVANKGEAQTYLEKNVEKTEMVKPISLHLDSTEPDATHPVLSVQNQSQDANQNLTAVAPNMVEYGKNSNSELKKENSIEVDAGKSSTLHAKQSTLMELATLGIARDQRRGQEQISKVSVSTRGHDSNINLGSSDCKEGYNSAYEQENLSPTVDAHTKSSLHVDSQVADVIVTEMQQAEQMNKKDADIVFTASDVEDKHDFGRFSTETFSADVNVDGEVSSNERGELPIQSPPKYEEKTINSEVLRPNCNGSEVSVYKNGVSIGSPGTETEFPVQKEVKEDSVKNSSEDQLSEETKLVTLGRTSTEKLSIPLLSYIKEEGYSAGSQKKQERLVANKAIKNKRNSHDDKTPGSTQGREKRKPKPLFFGICMCCTTEIL